MVTSMTHEDYERRMDRAGRAAADAGLAGLIVTPGPDLVWLCGYRPPAATERLTALVIEPGRRSRLLVPVLEYPDAELSPGAPALEVSGWTRRIGTLCGGRQAGWTRKGVTGSPTRPGRCICWGSSGRCRGLRTPR